MASTPVKKKKKKQRAKKEEEVLDLNMEIDFGDDEEEATPAPKKKSRKKVEDPEGLAKQSVAKLQQIKKEMAERIFEREEVLDDLMRALIAGENILLLGPPGTGKTLLAKDFGERIEEGTIFSWLMNRTTDPSDIVGPFSVKQMENDRFLRVTTGKAPEANVAFFDEIFKANEPSLNFMLSMLNEGIFYNDGKANPVELRIAIGASNEYPDTDELEAFYDRFIFRHWVNYLQDPVNRIAMAKSARESKTTGGNIVPPTTITLGEIDNLQRYVHEIDFPDKIATVYDRMYRALQGQAITVSDRRYYKGQVVMMANALLNGRESVSTEDFKALKYVLWNKDVRELDVVEKELSKFVNPYESKIKELVRKAEEVKTTTMSLDNRTERAGEAVQANASLQDILGKIEDEIHDAGDNGVDTAPLKKHLQAVEDIMQYIAEECLKPASRGTGRKW